MIKILVFAALVVYTLASPRLFGEDGVLHKTAQKVHERNQKLADKTVEAVAKAKTDIKEANERARDKAVKIIKGEEPIVDVAVNTRVKVLHSEVGVQGEVKIGFGHQTGAHAAADATILGQKASVHGDFLNMHKPVNQGEETYKHVSVISKVKELVNKKLNKNHDEGDNEPSERIDEQNGKYGKNNDRVDINNINYRPIVKTFVEPVESDDNNGEYTGRRIVTKPIDEDRNTNSNASRGKIFIKPVDENHNTYHNNGARDDRVIDDSYNGDDSGRRVSTKPVDNNRNTYRNNAGGESYNTYSNNGGGTSGYNKNFNEKVNNGNSGNSNNNLDKHPDSFELQIAEKRLIEKYAAGKNGLDNHNRNNINQSGSSNNPNENDPVYIDIRHG